jgi:hypothetical protein
MRIAGAGYCRSDPVGGTIGSHQRRPLSVEHWRRETGSSSVCKQGNKRWQQQDFHFVLFHLMRKDIEKSPLNLIITPSNFVLNMSEAVVYDNFD